MKTKTSKTEKTRLSACLNPVETNATASSKTYLNQLGGGTSTCKKAIYECIMA